MGKRQRSRRQRERRFVARSAPAAVAERTEAEVQRDVQREIAMARSGREVRPRLQRSTGGGARANGQPSNALLKAATAEYGHVMHDLRYVAIVSGASVALLLVAGYVATAILG